MEPNALNKNELEVLRILWERKQLKPAEIQEAFAWEIENPTLRSILFNLVGKGYITRRRHGKAYRYAAQVPKATLLQVTSRALARVFSGGSMKELVMQLVETEDIAPTDLEFIRATAAGRTAKPRKRITP